MSNGLFINSLNVMTIVIRILLKMVGLPCAGGYFAVAIWSGFQTNYGKTTYPFAKYRKQNIEEQHSDQKLSKKRKYLLDKYIAILKWISNTKSYYHHSNGEVLKVRACQKCGALKIMKSKL